MKKRPLFLLLIASLLTACHEDIATGQSAKQGEPLDLSATVSQEYVTRASDGGFANGDQIGVFIANYTTSDGTQWRASTLQLTGNHADNVRFTYNESEGKWTASYQLYWKDKQTPVDAYGYYPFDGELSSIEAYPFVVQKRQDARLQTGRQLSGYEASDFLWAKAENKLPHQGPIMLNHHHLMAGIKVVLTEGEGFDEGEWEKIEKKVQVEGTKLQSTINLQTGTVSIVASSSVESIVPQQSSDTYRAVVVPQTVAAEQTLFSFTIDGKSSTFARSGSVSYLSGKLHQFTFSVNKLLEPGDYELKLTDETITDWENDSKSHNGEAREYVMVHVGEQQFLGDVIESLGLDPSKIVNLKITGYLGKSIAWYDEWTGQPHYLSGSRHFEYMRENMPNLEALNLREIVNINGPAEDYAHSWKQSAGIEKVQSNPYEQDVSNYDHTLPYCAFENMASLRYFVWPEKGLEAIGSMAFAGSGLSGSLILPEGVIYIGGSVFSAYGHKACSLTGDVYIPSTVEYIGGSAFGSNDGNVNMCFFTNELILPAKMKYLGSNAFGGCPYMTGTIRVPDGITELNNAWPDQIKGPVVIPQGVKKINGIPRGATHVKIPEGVETIGSRAFEMTKLLRCDVQLPSTVKTIGDNAFVNSALTHITLPEGLELIEGATFYNCENLQDTVVIPSTVTQIRADAFANCRQLTAIILPAGLQGIQDEAFANCYSLDYIECLASEPPAIEENTFSGVEKDNFTVVVPEGAVEAYKNAPHWKEFKRISAYRNFVCRPMKAKLLNKSNVRDVVLNADGNWSVTSCPTWAHVSQTSGSKKTELKVAIDAMAHGSGDRTGEIVFTLNRKDDEGNPITCKYTIEQFDYEIDEDAVLTLQTHTKGNGINILFVGDGYDAEDIAHGTYRTDMEQEMAYFFGVEPYKTYRPYFNVSAAMAMSYESGAVDSPDKWRNTKFNITWGAGNNGRLAVPFDDIATYVLTGITNSPVTAANVGNSLIICVPNSDAYEGLTAMYGDGSAIAVCPMSKLDYPNDARGLIQHEAGGHGWAKLDDEYVYHRDNIHTCPCLCCSHVDGIQSMHAMGWGRNLSLSGKYSDVPWSHLINHSQYRDIVDIYEGGHMHARGVYRSEVNSVMNNNVPYFSSWSRQIIVERIKKVAGEKFSFEEFVANDSRLQGDKFLAARRSTPVFNEQPVYSEHHHPVIKPGRMTDYVKKGGKR